MSRRDFPPTIYDYPVERLTEISQVLLLGVAEWGRGGRAQSLDVDRDRR